MATASSLQPAACQHRAACHQTPHLVSGTVVSALCRSCRLCYAVMDTGFPPPASRQHDPLSCGMLQATSASTCCRPRLAACRRPSAARACPLRRRQPRRRWQHSPAVTSSRAGRGQALCLQVPPAAGAGVCVPGSWVRITHVTLHPPDCLPVYHLVDIRLQKPSP